MDELIEAGGFSALLYFQISLAPLDW